VDFEAYKEIKMVNIIKIKISVGMKKIREKKIRFYIVSAVSSVFVFLLNFGFAMAEFSYQPLSPLPDTLVSGKVTNLGTYITGIYKIAIGSAIVLAVVMLIFAGLEWMTAGAVGKKEDAIKKINAALFGLLLTLGSWLFLNTINPAAVNFNLKLTEVNIVDTSAPIIGGYYCQSEPNGPYYGPYKTEESCVEKTDCVPTSVTGEGSRYCIKAGPEWKGGPTDTGLNDEILIDKFFDTGITTGGKFIKLSGPGMYFNVDIYSYDPISRGYIYDKSEQRGPYKTKQLCVDAQTTIGTGGATEKVKGECYFVEWGGSDFVLNKMLADENTNEIRKKFSVPINKEACKYVGQTGCTNVGGLHFSVIENTNALKTYCDSWVVKEKLPEKSCPITLTAGTEWWLHGGGVEKNIDKNTTYHKPTFWKPEVGRDIDMSSNGTTKNIFTHYIIRHTDKICSGGKDITKEKTMDPDKKKENLTYLEHLAIGQTFNPGNMVKFCIKSPSAMFRFETKDTHWHVRFGTCGCN